VKPRAVRRWWVGLGDGSLPGPAAADAGGHDVFVRRNNHAVARVRVLLAVGNALVIYFDPSLPPSTAWTALVAAYGTVTLIIAYALWVWRQERGATPPAYLDRLTTCLDIFFGAALIWSTGAHRSPFYMWNVFTIVGSSLKDGWRTALRSCLAQIALYVAICLPNYGRPDFVLGTFLVRSTYLFLIALVLGHMGQRLLEQNRMLAGLHSAATHMSAGRTTAEILGCIADSLTDLLDAEQVAVAVWDDGADSIPPALVNLDRAQGERLLHLARSEVAEVPRTDVPYSVLGSADMSAETPGIADGMQAEGAELLITRFPGSRGCPGVLIARCPRGGIGFTASDRDLAELLAAQAGPLLETARLQEQRRYHAGVDERRRIASELHDGLIQTLASIDLRAVGCTAMWRDQRWSTLGDELQVLKRLAEEALGEARGAVNELAPVRLREEGLRVYLEDCLRGFRERGGPDVAATIHLAEDGIPEPTALLLIGLLREGLNNVRKHARATRVTLAIRRQGPEITFDLTDDGVGFAPDHSPTLHTPTRHYGLAYLRERVAAVGGDLRVTSRPGNGTTLAARVPLLTEERAVTLLSRTAA
jgi:signal transduction histidine kinase